MSRLALAVAVVVSLPSLAVAAPSRAWTAAKKVHPDAPIIAGIDVASARSSESFKALFPKLLDKKPTAKDVLARLDATCKFDPFTAARNVVAVIDDGNDNRGGFYISLAGWNAAKLGNCVKKIAAEEGKKLTIGPVKKGIQELSLADRPDKLYLGWIGKDVLVVGTEPTDKALLESLLRGKGRGKANQLANKLDSSATVWMVVMKEQSIGQGTEMKALYGTVVLANATASGDLHVVTGGTDQAATLVTMFNNELPKLRVGLPPAARALAQSLALEADGAEVHAVASAPEKDILALLALLF